MSIYKVGAVIIDNRRLLVTRKNVPGRTTFIIPGGRAEAGESDGETCIREIGEELNVKVKSLTYLDTYREAAEFEDESLTMPVFIAETIGEPKVGNEVVEIAWIDSSYAAEGYELGSTLVKHIIPTVARMGLIE